jgi:glycerophosphoryl diester phosphodiesterase
MTVGGRQVKCIGHGGASALASANTLPSFALAARLGADLVEFDVRLARGRLLLAHNVLDARRAGCLELEPALRWLAGEIGDVELVVDLKTRGTEEAVIRGLRRHGLLERSIVASQCRPILRRVRAVEPRARTAISVGGRLSRWAQRWGEWREEVLAELRSGRYAALMAHRRLVDAQLVDGVRRTGAELHAWTARGRDEVAALVRIGVDGIVTADPRLLPVR